MNLDSADVMTEFVLRQQASLNLLRQINKTQRDIDYYHGARSVNLQLIKYLKEMGMLHEGKYDI